MPYYNVWHVCEYSAVLEYDDSSGLIIVHPNLGNQGDLKKGDVEASLAEKENYTACDWTVKVAHASHSCTMTRFDFCTFVLLQRRDGRTCTEVNITSTRNGNERG